ncbi:MAG: type I-E CRISPR-associated protein Cas5/CasD [Anaerolineaceae bacterium]|nr:type I-E CRISPR-associated protein Cas5/CasD [Anaerolineaceae bacterium]
MSTLLIRLVAPLQSWGTQSNFTNRDTGLEPSKSGLLGLVCAALGRPRQAALDDLIRLRMAVRVDRPGIIQRDFQIVQNVLLSKGNNTKDSIITNRFYLSGAAFLAGLEGELSLLREIQLALQHPVWPLYFGRKAFAPAMPVWMDDGLRENQNLEEALQSCDWLVAWPPEKAPQQILCVLEDVQGSQLRNDVPLCFAERTFDSRRVTTLLIDAPQACRKEIMP